MGFWLFMFLFNLILQLMLIGFGRLFCHHAPSEINSVFGYRTRRSMLNQDTWQFAHKHIGKTWKRLGLVLLLSSAIAMIFLFSRKIDLVGRFGSLITGIQVVFLIASVFPTESALKQTFDEKGERKEPQR